MSVRFQHAVAAMMVVPMLGLSGCAEKPAVAEAAPAGPFIKLSPPTPRPRRVDPCKLAKRDLPPERKEALFKQFTAEVATDPTLQAAAATPAAPSPAPPAEGCKQAVR